MTIATALVYLLAAILFILGLLFLSSPRAARHGNWVAAAGMILAVGWSAPSNKCDCSVKQDVMIL